MEKYFGLLSIKLFFSFREIIQVEDKLNWANGNERN